MKNVCIVGYGSIGPIHAAAISNLNSANLYAICDISAEKLIRARNDYNVKTYTSFDEMLLDECIDSVHICTPHYLHLDMIKSALRSGKDVVCEKPVTMTKAEYDELLLLKNAEKICVVLQNRLNPCIKRFKEIIQENSLGNIMAAKSLLTWYRNINYYNRDKWRGKWTTEGGGVLINQAVHTLDLFSYILGDVQSVKAQISNFSIPEIEVEDTVSAYLRLKCDAPGIFYATNAYGNDASPDFEVIFEKGIVSYRNSRLFLNDMLIAENPPTKLGKSYWGNGHGELIKNFYDKGEYFSPIDIKNTMYTLFAIYESAKNNSAEIYL